MPQSLAKILVHAVFSTHERRPFLRDKTLRADLHSYMAGILTQFESQPLTIGGVEDHVHALFVLSRTTTLADTIKELKRGSTVWLKLEHPNFADFAWQNGYGAFSVAYSQLDDVRKYIGTQDEHHRKTSFQDEYRQLLKRYEVEFDERYVWD